jgi:hypothetical protein
MGEGDILKNETSSVLKDPAAVALGRKGGLKGGIARAKKLTAIQRSEIAKKAAAARWKTIEQPATEALEPKSRNRKVLSVDLDDKQ